MTALHRALVYAALFLGACAPDDPAPVAAVVPIDAPLQREAKRAGKFAALDTNGDGLITQAELAGHELAPLFAELDGDGDDAISRAEFQAFKHARHRRPAPGQAHG